MSPREKTAAEMFLERELKYVTEIISYAKNTKTTKIKTFFGHLNNIHFSSWLLKEATLDVYGIALEEWLNRGFDSPYDFDSYFESLKMMRLGPGYDPVGAYDISLLIRKPKDTTHYILYRCMQLSVTNLGFLESLDLAHLLTLVFAKLRDEELSQYITLNLIRNSIIDRANIKKIEILRRLGK